MTKNAFTLAEVLITLGIIGVVAAMTMPTLINQTNGAQYKAAYKKALSAISQGVTLNVALEDVSFADTDAGTAGSVAANSTSGKATIASLLNSRMNVVSSTKPTDYSLPSGIKADATCKEGDDTCTDGKQTVTTDTYLFFNDGSMFTFKGTDKECTKDAPCFGVIDVNGAKGPNKLVVCDATTTENAQCTVTSPTDIYPVEFYDQTILPASDAAKAVLYGK